MNKIILSRKGYDDLDGGKPSVILSDVSNLSFPIPVSEIEAGTQLLELRYKNSNSKIFIEDDNSIRFLKSRLEKDVFYSFHPIKTFLKSKNRETGLN